MLFLLVLLAVIAVFLGILTVKAAFIAAAILIVAYLLLGPFSPGRTTGTPRRWY